VNPTRVLYHMIRADFLERVRRYSFLVTLAGSLWLAYAVAAEKLWIVVGDGYRGVYNSAWIGALMAVSCSTFLSLVGFYIVKNSVQRDRETRVGQILAATPMRKDFYTLAKTLSNFAVLGCMVFILMLAAIVMQRMQAASQSFSLWQLWSPFIFLTLPAMLLTASVAVLFETIPFLRGGLGNVIYFFAWTAILAMSVNGVNDPTGLQLIYASTRNTLMPIDPSVADHFSFSLTIGGERAVRTFLWNGIDWTGTILLMRLFWIAIAAGIALLASLLFDRFDPARSWRRSKAAPAARTPDATVPETDSPLTSYPSTAPALPPSQLTAATRTSSPLRFAPLVVCELRLMLKGQRWWWYVSAAGILVGQLVAPDAGVRAGFLIASGIWPILLWSQMGCRERRWSTSALLFSCERSLTRQLPALWAAGFLLALLTEAGFGIRLLLAGDWHSLAAWLAGAAFIPSVALALGVWSGGSKAFEALYTIWWYMGPAHQIRGIDFMATTPASSTPATYAIAAAFLLTAAYWRRRQLLGYA